MDEPRAGLTIAGDRYEGWTSIGITRSIESLAGGFEFALATRQYSDAPRWPLRTAAECAVHIDSELIATGYVDAIEVEYDAGNHSITVSGRDRTGDLVDCSAVTAPGSWTGRKIEAIAQELAAPFGIRVTARVDTGAPVKRFTLQQGETVFAAIERLASFRALLPIATVDGQLELIRPGDGTAAAQLVEGENILVGRARHDARERYSDYLVKGQASGDDHASGKAVAGPKASARDPAIRRHRPLMVIGEDQATPGSLAKRAQWEASTRAARAQSAQLTVAGWRRPDGALWTPNILVGVKAPGLFIDGELLVSEVRLGKDESGTTTELTVTPREAFSLIAVAEDDAAALGRV